MRTQSSIDNMNSAVFAAPSPVTRRSLTKAAILAAILAGILHLAALSAMGGAALPPNSEYAKPNYIDDVVVSRPPEGSGEGLALSDRLANWNGMRPRDAFYDPNMDVFYSTTLPEPRGAKRARHYMSDYGWYSSNAYQWLANRKPTPEYPVSLEFDLQEVCQVGDMCVWNYATPGLPGEEGWFANGARDVRIFHREAEVDPWTLLGDYEFDHPRRPNDDDHGSYPVDNARPGNRPIEVGVRARFFCFEILSNWGGDNVGLAEVAFYREGAYLNFESPVLCYGETPDVPLCLDFAKVCERSERDLEVWNDGGYAIPDSDLTITSVTIAGDAAGVWTVTHDPLPMTLHGNTSRTMAVTFDADEINDYTAALLVHYSDRLGDHTESLTLRGSRNEYAFGFIPVAAAKASVAYENMGPEVLINGKWMSDGPASGSSPGARAASLGRSRGYFGRGEPDGQWIKFDLGRTFGEGTGNGAIDEMWVWPAWYSSSLRSVSLYVSSDSAAWEYDMEVPPEAAPENTGWVFVCDAVFPEPGDWAGFDQAWRGELSDIPDPYRYVMILVRGERGDGNYGGSGVSLGQVRFYHNAPALSLSPDAAHFGINRLLSENSLVLNTGNVGVPEAGDLTVTSITINAGSGFEHAQSFALTLIETMKLPRRFAPGAAEDFLVEYEPRGVGRHDAKLRVYATDGSKVNIREAALTGEAYRVELGFIAGVTAVASSWGAGQAVDGAGIIEWPDPSVHGSKTARHSVGDGTSWLSGPDPVESAWIEFDLQDVYLLDEMWVWNYMQLVNFDAQMKTIILETRAHDYSGWQRFGGEDSTFELYATGECFDDPSPATNLADGDNDPTNNPPIEFAGLLARAVRIRPAGGGGIGSYGFSPYGVGLGEVRFYGRRPDDPIISPTALDFGSHPVNSAATETFAISNPSDEWIEIEEVFACGAETPFSVTDPDGRVSIPPGDSIAVMVRFAPGEAGLGAGKYEGYLVALRMPMGGEPLYVTVQGTAFDTGTPDVEVAQDVIDFWSHECLINTVPDPVSLPLTISNLGDSDLLIASLTLTDASAEGNPSPDCFQIDRVASPEEPLVVEPLGAFDSHGTEAILLTFKAVEAGAYEALLTMGCNDPDEPEVHLTARGDLYKRDFGFIRGVRAKASSQDSDAVPSRAVDGNGMSEVPDAFHRGTREGLHATNTRESSWLSNSGQPVEEVWIEFDLGGCYWLDEMWIWNFMQRNYREAQMKSVLIETRENAEAEWTRLGGEDGTFDFYGRGEDHPDPSPATNLQDGDEEPTNNVPVEFEAVAARHVRIRPAGGPGVGSYGADRVGLGEVRFYGWLGNAVTVTPKRFEFGSRPFGSVTTKTLTIRNASETPLRIDEFLVSVDPSPFSVSAPDSGLEIPPGGSAAVAVRYAPTYYAPDPSGYRNHRIAMLHEGEIVGPVVTCHGNAFEGGTPDVRVKIDRLEYGERTGPNGDIPEPVTLSFVVENLGDTVLNVTSLKIEPAYPEGNPAEGCFTADRTATTTEPLAVAPQSAPTVPGVETIAVTFAPTARGHYYARLRLESDDPDEPEMVIKLEGNCRLRPDPVVYLSPFDGETNLPDDLELTWERSALAWEFDVYLGESPDLGEDDFLGVCRDTRYAPELRHHNTYYWRIDAVNDLGVTAGAVWSFSTAPDIAPPVSFVKNLPWLSPTASLKISVSATDPTPCASGVLLVQIHYRKDDGFWTPCGVVSSPEVQSLDVDFSHVGDGYYEFRCAAIDFAGNRELFPSTPDTATLVLADFSGNHVYVSKTGSGRSGLAWSSALRVVDLALELAKTCGVREVWVAKGVYHEAIEMPEGVSLYGGFSGVEEERDARDWRRNPTVIDAGSAWKEKPADYAVRISYVSDVLVDGFIITGAGSEADLSGGICLLHVDNSVRISNCVITQNHSLCGGGINCYFLAYPRIENCTITSNVSVESGGGIYCYASMPKIRNCIITGNLAVQRGGGVSCTTYMPDDQFSPLIMNSILADNSAGERGGGVFSKWSAPGIVNSVIAWNSAPSGAGACFESTQSFPDIVNTIFVGNSEHAIFAEECRPDGMLSCLFHDNSGGDLWCTDGTVLTGADALNDGIEGAEGILDDDPLFVMDGPDAVTGTWTQAPVFSTATLTATLTDANAVFEPGALAGEIIQTFAAEPVYTTVVDNTETTVEVIGNLIGQIGAGDAYRLLDLRLRRGSAAIDAGSAEGAPDTDMEGTPRPIDIDGLGADGTGAEYDIGAFEMQWLPLPATVIEPRFWVLYE